MTTSSQARHLLPLMLALTFSTGIIDSVGYLGLDRVFTGNMTGNVVILGMALTGAAGLPIIGPLLALLGFMAGAAVAGRVFMGQPTGWRGATTILLAIGAVGMAAVSTYLLAEPAPPHAAALVVTAVLGGVMGMQAGTARHIAVKDVTTVVVTSTLAGLAGDSIFGNGTGAQPWRRGSAVVLISAGAAVGALLLRWHLGAGVLLACLVTLAVAITGHAYHLDGQRQRTAHG